MPISLNRIDLNLLRVFDAVMDERSVLRASQRVCLSQSAVSHALARLREMLGDELFIRTTSGMQPTTRALAMAPLIREAWRSLEAAIGTPEFDPSRATARFTIAVSDFETTVLVPSLLRLLRQEAPLVDLVIRPASNEALAEQIDLGQVDAAIGSFSNVPSRFRKSPLFSYNEVLIADSSLKLGKLTLEMLSTLSIAAVNLHGEHDANGDNVTFGEGVSQRSVIFNRAALERALANMKRAPRMPVCLPHLLALPALLENTDLTAILPRPLAQSLVANHPLSMHELPYTSPDAEVQALWHERTLKDAAQVWLRTMLKRASEHAHTFLDCNAKMARPAATLARSPGPIFSHRLVSRGQSSESKLVRM
jgi:DNA-binding transcriptional LysR family regulator